MKKCPFCAELIQDDAIVCRYCGREIAEATSTSTSASIAPAETATPQGSSRGPSFKKPWLAVVLNLFPLVMGIGYLYLGLPIRFIVVFGIQLLSLFPMTLLGLRDYNTYVLAGLWLFSLIDAYNQATKRNTKASRSAPPSASRPGAAQQLAAADPAGVRKT